MVIGDNLKGRSRKQHVLSQALPFAVYPIPLDHFGQTNKEAHKDKKKVAERRRTWCQKPYKRIFVQGKGLKGKNILSQALPFAV